MKRTKRKPETIPEARELEIPTPDYQPSKAEQEEEVDMPGLSRKQLRATFFRPFGFVRGNPRSR